MMWKNESDIQPTNISNFSYFGKKHNIVPRNIYMYVLSLHCFNFLITYIIQDIKTGYHISGKKFTRRVSLVSLNMHVNFMYA